MHRYSAPYLLSRVAFSARDAARAGDIWRAFQDVAVLAAAERGYSPRRLRDDGSAFVVRSMTVVHHDETFFGEPLLGESWVLRWRRETLSTREVRLRTGERPVASGTQEWVHVDLDGRMSRAPESMIESLGPIAEGGIELPAFEKRIGRSTSFSFRTFHTWMDPLGHVNHPHYVDFCDEATSDVMARAGLDPLRLRPRAEKMTFRLPVFADSEVTVSTTAIGTLGNAVVLAHVLTTEDGERRTEGVTVRDLVDGSNDLLQLFYEGI